jgi:hypothetical protein
MHVLQFLNPLLLARYYVVKGWASPHSQLSDDWSGGLPASLAPGTHVLGYELVSLRE